MIRARLLCWAFLLLMLWSAATLAQKPDCQVAAEQGAVSFEVERLCDADRCRISEVITHFSTSGTMGPWVTPINWELYAFLLDHPPLAASLVRAINLAGYEISKREQNVWWANDGEGTQGLATLAYKDRTTRIYYMKGSRDGMLFGRVYADAVLFMQARPEEGEPSVETVLVVYTHLDKRHWMLNKLIPLVRPLISRTVTRIVGKAFTVAHTLGTRIAEDPEQVLKIAASLPTHNPDELQTLVSLLRTATMP